MKCWKQGHGAMQCTQWPADAGEVPTVACDTPARAQESEPIRRAEEGSAPCTETFQEPGSNPGKLSENAAGVVPRTFELFAGSCKLSKCLKAHGFAAVGIDHKKCKNRVGPCIVLDLSRSNSAGFIEANVDEGDVFFIPMAPPCGTKRQTNTRLAPSARSSIATTAEERAVPQWDSRPTRNGPDQGGVSKRVLCHSSTSFQVRSLQGSLCVHRESNQELYVDGSMHCGVVPACRCVLYHIPSVYARRREGQEDLTPPQLQATVSVGSAVRQTSHAQRVVRQQDTQRKVAVRHRQNTHCCYANALQLSSVGVRVTDNYQSTLSLGPPRLPTRHPPPGGWQPASSLRGDVPSQCCRRMDKWWTSSWTNPVM